MREMRKVMAANRGEIAIRIFRACTELGLRTVAIYSYEDRFSLHRYKADEAYLVGRGKDPIQAYMDYKEIVELALDKGVDAIHPGYGFLSENADFARECINNGIIWVGPPPEVIEAVGDKVRARELAKSLGIPVIPGTDGPVETEEDAVNFAESVGYPVIIKAASGGGGRGMRVAHNQEELRALYHVARSEAEKAFGDSRVFLEKFLERPRHIEVQILGDNYGRVVHLYERDCSIQRRHQKLIEVAPARHMSQFLKEQLYESALRIAKAVGYVSAGTVEFLVEDGNYYFIEVNPRIQVEHTVTEMITGRDIVQAQLRIARGESLEDIGIMGQEYVKKSGYAIQCRVTTEDPENNFVPDTGRVTVYRTAVGFGIRLDGGNGFVGARITPYYDSLLVKVTSWALTFEDAVAKMDRALREFRIRGVKTNIPFLLNVIGHPTFREGVCDTTFVDSTPELFRFPERRDRGNKILKYIADVTVNGFPGIPREKVPRIIVREPEVPKVKGEPPSGTKQLLDEAGPEAVVEWIKSRKELLLTDTTFRDAHQSLLATRVRTYDMLRIAPVVAHRLHGLFSLEMWGGATFDVAMRFLKEDPWDRLVKLRQAVPNILFQMLLRGSNAVGYTNYPDNVVRAFIREAAQAGIDLFRIFDCFNWIENMKVAIDEALKTGKLVEVALCYTSDLTNPDEKLYTLDYYVGLAKELASLGVHIIGIKDMAGLCKPDAAYKLVKAIKEETGLPVHFHTHDTAGTGVATYLAASEAGVDIVDVAISSMAGVTSQPPMEALIASLKGTEREPSVSIEDAMPIASYWERVREFYAPFESELRSSTGEVYFHEIPGGQYSNLKPRAIQLGLGDRWEELKEMYARVNRLLGNIIKVTPSSKVVADLAIFMLKNNLTEEDLLEKGHELNFPQSVVDFFKGMIGKPPCGFNRKLQEVVLKGEKPIDCRPGELLPPVDFDEKKRELRELLGREPTMRDVLSAVLYPGVYEEFVKHQKEFSDTSVMKTPLFFYGLELGQEDFVDIEEGKTLVIKLSAIGELLSDGTRIIYFELNGQPREVRVRDRSVKVESAGRAKAEAGNPAHVGAPMPGKVVRVKVKPGDKVKKGEHLVIVEAMKIETPVVAHRDGTVKDVLVGVGDQVEQGDLLVVFE